MISKEDKKLLNAYISIFKSTEEFPLDFLINTIKMKNKKYYTPEIEEFHVGFEFEYANISSYGNSTDIDKNTMWLKHTLEYFDNCYTTEHGDHEAYSPELMGVECMRVKYLDRKDIEELGYTVEKDTEYTGYYHYSKDSNLSSEASLSFEFIPEEDNGQNIEIFNTYFKIKNKSELKTLLKQLGIN